MVVRINAFHCYVKLQNMRFCSVQSTSKIPCTYKNIISHGELIFTTQPKWLTDGCSQGPKAPDIQITCAV